jgi:hypothetical protein
VAIGIDVGSHPKPDDGTPVQTGWADPKIDSIMMVLLSSVRSRDHSSYIP